MLYRSVKGTIVQQHAVEQRDVLTIVQRYGFSEILASILVARKVHITAIDDFLAPTLYRLMPNPFSLKDMDKAVERIILAISNREKIVVYGDYDVDGATSCALLKKYFALLNIEVGIYIPDRINEGYGPNTKALLKLKQQRYTLCITVDCGVTAHEPLSAAQRAQLDIIVIDHHMTTSTIPTAVAVVNPNRFDQQDNPCQNLAAVGVCFLFVVAINATLISRGLACVASRKDIFMLIDLVALGTVCDVVKLIAFNRALVFQGLKVLAQRNNLGLSVLADALCINSIPNSYHLGFLFGPSINAGGRIGEASLGARLLSTNDAIVAQNIAVKLKNLNEERKAIEQEVLQQALKQVENNKQLLRNCIVVANNTWHPGVIGIVASRLKDLFHLPTTVISISNGIGKASSRSISSIDIGAAVLAAKAADLVIEGGGHEMAAGFSIAEEKIPLLKEFFYNRFTTPPQKIIFIDAYLTIQGINMSLWQEIQLVEPFGTSNPEPVFVLRNITLKNAVILKNSHIKCTLYDEHSNCTIKAIAFRAVETALGDSLLHRKITAVIGKITANTWQNRTTLEFIISDAM